MMLVSRCSLLLACLVDLAFWPLLTANATPNSVAESYTCETEQRGFHILQWTVTDCSITIWKNSLRKKAPLRIPFEKNSAGECHVAGGTGDGYKEMLRRLEEHLKLPPREPYQQPARYFTPQGGHVLNKEDWDRASKVGPVFLLEGGQFQWPPVSVGHKQQVEGLTNNGVQIELETLSCRPPIFRVFGLASDEETDALIEYAKPYFRKAEVVYMDHDKGKKVDEFRTSLNHRPDHNETALIATMEARTNMLTRMPPKYFEEAQILEYAKGGFYHAHDDAARLEFYAKDKSAITGHHYGYFDRMLTVFWYMNTVTKGGSTNFPMAGGLDPPPTMRKCMQGLMVAPVKGMAVMWYNMEPRGLVDKYALHAACPVEAGDKHAINIWVYNKPRKQGPAKWDPKHPRMKAIRGTSQGDEDEEEESDFSVNLVNSGSSKVHVFWKGPDSEVLVAELEPREERSLNTFFGHIFIAKLPTGEELGVHKVSKLPRRQRFDIPDAGGKEL